MLPTSDTGSDLIQRCINKVLLKNDSILLAYTGEAIVDFPNPVQLIDLSKDLKLLLAIERFLVYIVVIQEILDLEIFFGLLYRTVNYNSRARTVVVYSGDEDIEGIFKVLWKYYIINVLLIDRRLDIYTYYPLSQGNCTAFPVVTLSKCVNFQLGEFQVFSEHYVRYFPNCEMRTYMFKVKPYTSSGGIEEMMIYGIMAQLKMRLKFLPHNYPDPGLDDYNNGTYRYMLGDLFNKKCDIVFGFITLYTRFCKDFDCTLPQCFSYMTFFVPLAEPIEIWQNIFLTFRWHAWLALLLVSLLISAIWLGFDRSESFLRRYVYLFGIFFHPVPKQPNTYKLRIIFLAWVLFSFFIMRVFESVMVSFLSKPNYEPQISNVEEMLKSRINFGGFIYLKNYFNSTDTEQNVQLYNRYMTCTSPRSCNKLKNIHKKFGMLVDKRIAVYEMKRDNEKFYMLPTIITAFPTLYLDKGSPYRKRVNEAITRLYENGLNSKWDIYMKIANTNHNAPDEVIALRLDHLMAAIGIYICGVLLSVISFLYENQGFRIHKYFYKEFNNT